MHVATENRDAAHARTHDCLCPRWSPATREDEEDVPTGPGPLARTSTPGPLQLLLSRRALPGVLIGSARLAFSLSAFQTSPLLLLIGVAVAPPLASPAPTTSPSTLGHIRTADVPCCYPRPTSATTSTPPPTTRRRGPAPKRAGGLRSHLCLL